MEPYVVAADVYALEDQFGRGGWTWYTGSSGWMYRVWIEEILGFKLRGTRLTINPVIPRSWEGFSSHSGTAEPNTRSTWRIRRRSTAAFYGWSLTGSVILIPRSASWTTNGEHAVTVMLGTPDAVGGT